MKVRCVQLLDLGGASQRSSAWLTIGATYQVLEILADPMGEKDLLFRIMSDDRETPIMARASEFELVTNSIPRCWRVSFLPDSLLYFAPSDWMEPGLWVRFFDHNEAELRIFERYYREMLTEDP